MFSAIKEIVELFKKSKEVEKMDEPTRHKWLVSCTDGGEKHDWATAHQINVLIMIKDHPDVGWAEVKWDGIKGSRIYFRIKGQRWPVSDMSIVSTQFVNQTVCLACGECRDRSIDVMERVKKAIAKQKSYLKKEAERKALAQKMWKSCEKGVS